MSYSEIAGNVSFILIVTAYLNTDILILRYLAMSSITLSIIFQYYRIQPLWIPIKWNLLLLVVNITMAIKLLYERYKAQYTMPKEWEFLYENANFHSRGFNRVEFYKFMTLGTKLTMKHGDILAKDGQINTAL